MDLRLSGKRVLVTGASRGIGRAIADTFAAEGCSLALCARGAERLEEVAGELRAAATTVVTEAFDVSDEEALAAFVNRTAHELGGLDVVVSNVSAGSSKDRDQWHRSLTGDLLPLVRLIESAVPHMEGTGGAIVAIGTTNAFDTVRPGGPSGYSALKAAVLQHAAAQARQLAPRGIRVNSVSPGPIEFGGGDWERIREGRPEVYAEVVDRIPVGRCGTPEEVAAAVAFLASPRAAFCSGVNLVVDGGMVSRVQF
jgi:3-oxoacyl-[acyl-carrier protein] reductase